MLVVQLGVLFFESAQLARELVVLRVGNGRRVVDEVGLVVARELRAQPRHALGGLHAGRTIAAPSTTAQGSSTRYITTD